MGVRWTCDRCGKAHQDNGVRISKLNSDWSAYYLSKVMKDQENDFEATLIQSIHLCPHCTPIIEGAPKHGPKIDIQAPVL
jgi:hypothetical protein